MTENEAKTLLESKKEEAKRITNNFLSYSGGEIRKANRTIEMCDMAIQALEAIQQYRAIGTVEELKSMKENGAFTGVELAQLAAMQMRLKEYSAIGTIDEFKALKEKSVAKKMSIGNDNGKSRKCCGNCRCFVLPTSSYCSKCGQKLDWQ